MIPEWLSHKLRNRNIDISITKLNARSMDRILVELRDSADKKGGKSWAQTFDPSELDISDKMSAYIIQFMNTSIH
jgi:hypothetical protein